MGLIKFIKSQFIEVIEWTDNTSDTMVYRFPVENKEIKMGAQLTVRESQTAVFINEGKIADVFSPGRYVLSTENMPVLTKLRSWKYGFDSPFKAEVYFVNTKQFTNQKWGTSNPVMMRDSEFGMLRLRAYGNYSYRVSDAEVFMKEIFGSNQEFTTHKISGHLKGLIVSGLTDLLAESRIPALDLAMHYDELSQMAKEKMNTKFGQYGFSLTTFFIENISLPEEVEKVMDKRTSMGVLGNLNQYTQYQSAEAIRDAAKNSSGFAGAGVGIGAGAAIGNIMGKALNNQNQGQNIQAQNTIPCPNCREQILPSSKFCNVCGKPVQALKVKCINCEFEINKNSKFCPECGEAQNVKKKCDNCGAEITFSSKFCPECGNKSK